MAEMKLQKSDFHWLDLGCVPLHEPTTRVWPIPHTRRWGQPHPNHMNEGWEALILQRKLSHWLLPKKNELMLDSQNQQPLTVVICLCHSIKERIRFCLVYVGLLFKLNSHLISLEKQHGHLQ